MTNTVKTTTCYMCACRCGIRVHTENNTVRYIEGNPHHPINKGVLCAKGSAGIMHHYSPARLRKPLLRIGERGSGEFREIEWDEALKIATGWLTDIRSSDPKKLAFFTGRDQSQSFTGWWAQQYGTPNYAAHGGFCSVNMAAAGLYTIGGSFWEFGEPDWEHTKYFLMFGVSEDHDSNPIKMGLGKLKSRKNTKFVSINPICTGYSSIADEWIGIRPGMDGLLIFSLIQELLKAEMVDWEYLVRYTNAHWLVIQDPGQSEHGLLARDVNTDKPLCFDKDSRKLRNATDAHIAPALVGDYQLPDGRTAVPSFQLLIERFLDPAFSADTVADKVGISAEKIKRLAAELADTAFNHTVEINIPWTDWTGRKHNKIIGRPVSMHAMRGISAHSNGFHTCRALHILQILLGTIDVPGGFRYKVPYPKHIPPPNKPAPPAEKANTPLGSMPLGFPTAPGDLLVDSNGTPKRIDKAYSWEYPLAIHGMMHMVIHNAWKGDPYKINTLFMYMSNMAWNSSMNVPDTLHYLTDIDKETGEYKIPHIIYSDAFYSETVPYADLVLPDTTYLERWDCISLLDRPIGEADAAADSIRQPVVKLDRDVRPFQDVLLELGVRLNLPGMAKADGSPMYPGGYSDYMVNHMRSHNTGPLAGWRGKDGDTDYIGPSNPAQIEKYIENGCFWRKELDPEQRYYKFANQSYLNYAHKAGWIYNSDPIIIQLYSESLQSFSLAAEGHGYYQVPAKHKERIKTYFDPLPVWYEPFGNNIADNNEYPLHALTQRPMYMYHSWGSQNAWLRQITSENRLYLHHLVAGRLGLKDEDWVWIESPHGKIKGRIKCMHGVNEDTVWTWNAIGKRKGSWNLSVEAPEAKHGFILNHIIPELLPVNKDAHQYSNSDPVTGQAAWFDLRVRINKCESSSSELSEPQFPEIQHLYSEVNLSNIKKYTKYSKKYFNIKTNDLHVEFVGNNEVYNND